MGQPREIDVCVFTYSLLGSAGFFKVSFLSLLTLEVLGNHGLNIGVDEALDFTIGKSLGTFAGL